MRFWRISNFADLSGEGGIRMEGRWHTRGQPAVYLSDHPSTSLLEILVHANRFTVPDTFQLLEIAAPDDIEIEAARMPMNWQKDEPATRAIGDAFLVQAHAPLLRVTSTIIPRAVNFIMNPAHRDAGQFRVVSAERYPFDSRLFTRDGE